MKLFKGISVSEGIAIGNAIVLRPEFFDVVTKKLRSNQIEVEIRRYFKSLDETSRHIKENKIQAERDLGKVTSQIFDAYEEIINDPFFREEIPRKIREEKLNAEFVLRKAVLEYASALKFAKDEYLKERLNDIFAVERWILRWLTSPNKQFLFSPPENAVLIARELLVQMVMNINRKKIIAIITEKGGLTGHAAILARSYHIPAIVQVSGILKEIKERDFVIVDGDAGKVILDPQPEIVQKYRMKLQEEMEHWQILQKRRFEPAVTKDGRRIKILANIGSADEAREAVGYGAEGVGLYRTEYSFIEAGKYLDEEEQFEIYREIAEILDGREVTIRTLDVGADKLLFQEQKIPETNPLLGLRSIRYFLTQDMENFEQQLRAIFRASMFGTVKILYPMITTMEEVNEIARAYSRVRKQLLQKNIPIHSKLERGIMIETPSAALLADHFMKKCHFLSIGTNDLIQYTLAVDRNNGAVAQLYQPLNPSVLRLIQMTVSAARAARGAVSVCGEMASEPLYIPLLVGLGVQVLSMNPVAVPVVKEVIRNISLTASQEMTRQVLGCGTVNEVLHVLNQFDTHSRFT